MFIASVRRPVIHPFRCDLRLDDNAASGPHLDLRCLPYVLYGVTHKYLVTCIPWLHRHCYSASTLPVAHLDLSRASAVCIDCGEYIDRVSRAHCPGGNRNALFSRASSDLLGNHRARLSLCVCVCSVVCVWHTPYVSQTDHL